MELETIQIPDDSDAQLEINVGAGFCKVCGKELDDGRKRYCDDHKGSQGKLPKVGSTKDRSAGSKAGKTAATSELTTVFGKILLLITAAYAWSQLRRMQVRDPGGAFAEALAMTDEEADAVARPIARAFNSSAAGVRYGRKIVDNSDLIDAGFALYEWYQRQTQMLEGLAQQVRKTNTQFAPSQERASSESAQQDQAIREQGGANVVPFSPDVEYLGAVEQLG